MHTTTEKLAILATIRHRATQALADYRARKSFPGCHKGPCCKPAARRAAANALRTYRTANREFAALQPAQVSA